MGRAFASSVLSLMLAIVLVWGGCVSCEQFFMFPGAKKTCCAPNGQCRTKAPAQQNKDKECKRIAFDHNKATDLHLELPSPVAIGVSPELALAANVCRTHSVDACATHSPPDLQILYSTFLV